MELKNIKQSFSENTYEYLNYLLQLSEKNNHQPFERSFSQIALKLNITRDRKLSKLNFYVRTIDEGNRNLFFFGKKNLEIISNYKSSSYKEQYKSRYDKATITKDENVRQELNEVYNLLGYDVNSELSIHEQFMIRHNLN